MNKCRECIVRIEYRLNGAICKDELIRRVRSAILGNRPPSPLHISCTPHLTSDQAPKVELYFRYLEDFGLLRLLSHSLSILQSSSVADPRTVHRHVQSRSGSSLCDLRICGDSSLCGRNCRRSGIIFVGGRRHS